MSITRKTILIEKYQKFQNELIVEGISPIFPSLEDIDLVDLLFYFEISFSGSNDYKETIKELMKYSAVQITDEELNKVYPLIESFINFILIDFRKI